MSTILTYEAASRVVAAALARASETGSPSCVSVVDAGRNLLAFARQDSAILAAVEVSQAKAYTAASLAMSTADLAPAVQPGGPFYGLTGSHGQPYIPFGGGALLRVDGSVVGAVGVGGGSPDQDADVAMAGAAALAVGVA
ncbi:GlcG/HbpS family heme-binding protein [Pseudonocardia sp. D17]|jgi:uncharacterized protein GlcG (DUF336 family)|uniref:GlcG/HbpS family heme-binding protein n=1 Tax=Pseudonocardia sp. D17 TaxID=882661 RepID=UPI0030CB8F93|nr:hypothetical protein PSD17_21000 [Pseudonocardia sp. D17]